MATQEQDTRVLGHRQVEVEITVLDHYVGAVFPPEYHYTDDSGFDLPACIEKGMLHMEPYTWELIPTGLCVAVPKGYELQIRSRSGLSYKKGLVVKNAPGTIDAGYRGELKVNLCNESPDTVIVHRADPIAQAVLAPVVQAAFKPVMELPTSERSTGGHGSTG